MLIASTRLLSSAEERTKCFDLAFEPGATDFEIVPFGLDILEFRLKAAHLVDALLTVAAGSEGVGFSLLNTGNI
jgi:hypothetical protein